MYIIHRRHTIGITVIDTGNSVSFTYNEASYRDIANKRFRHQEGHLAAMIILICISSSYNQLVFAVDAEPSYEDNLS